MLNVNEMKKLITLFLVSTVMMGNANAMDLKTSVNIMKTEVPERFQCMVDEIKAPWQDSYGFWYENSPEKALSLVEKEVIAYFDIRDGDYPSELVSEVTTEFPCSDKKMSYHATMFSLIKYNIDVKLIKTSCNDKRSCVLKGINNLYPTTKMIFVMSMWIKDAEEQEITEIERLSVISDILN